MNINDILGLITTALGRFFDFIQALQGMNFKEIFDAILALFGAF